MEKYIVVLFWILVLAIILLSVPTKCVSGNKKEGFHGFFTYHKQYCPSCGWRSKESCSRCTNCGICTTANGFAECSPGDASGPYYRTDCVYWNYGNPYNYYQNALAYPITLTKDMYPYNRWGMNRPFNFFKRIN